ncbi:MAG: SH3 domain-containing protein [Peptococcaceae bacterium]|nr:SH3 domain-containing protein [Peptococcaceae bacterium]
MKKILLAFSLGLAILLLLPILGQASPLAYSTERIFGQDRIETAIAISQKGWTSAHTVILCEKTDYPDSIAVAPLAAKLDAPILLTGGNSLDPRVVSELRRLQPQKVILLGGLGRLTSQMETDLNNLSLSWERIGGSNRYETSVLLAERISSSSLIIANGDNFPDALSAASYAGIKQIPIVLTSKNMPKSVVDYCQKIQPSEIIVIGGEQVVPTKSLAANNINITTRLGGSNRYETNALIVEYMKSVIESDDLFLVSGQDFPDAIAGTVLAAKVKAPLLLTTKEDIPPAVYSLMRLHMKVEPPAKSISGKGIITASGALNLRDIPSTAGKVILSIPQGATVDITAQQGQWYQTTYQNKTGWIYGNYVKIIQEYKQGEIRASVGLNLRQSPSINAKILMTLPNGAKIPIIEEKSGWYKTIYQGTTGWVSAEYVAINSSDSTAATIDLSPNGKVFIIGGTSVISENTQKIVEGKVSSQIKENLKAFPPLPSSLTGPDSESPYDPNSEILLDPFAGINPGVLKNKRILIDPGHGGPDSGAIGAKYSYEKFNNLAIALFLRDILTEAGAAVYMTRDSDTAVAPVYSEAADLQARVALANSIKPDLFISIHNDSMPNNREIKGTSTYYSLENVQKNQSALLAQALQTKLTTTLNTNDRGVKTANFYVLKHTKVPAALIEVAYISNPYEEARLKNPIFQKNVATAIFHGIIQYYESAGQP